jgi:competence protein ComEC
MAKADVAFWLSSSFILGILTAGAALPIFLIVLLASAGLAATATRLRITRPVACIMLVTLILGAVYHNLFQNARNALLRLPQGPDFIAHVAQEPQPTARALRLTLSLDPPHYGTMTVLTDQFRDFRYGDRVAVRGEIDTAQSPPFMLFPMLQIIARGEGSWLRARLFTVKRSLVAQFDRVLPATSAALLAGLTVGETKNFTPDFKTAMKQSGTTHLTALSGYNIVILVEAVRQALGRFLGRRKTFIFTTLIIVLFVLMVGAEASVVRAAIMGSLLLIAGETGRIYDLRNAVTFAALIMLLIDPTLLVESIGFQLSFMSLLGIAYLKPALARALHLRTESDSGFLGWREHVATTSAAQLMVLPILAMAFGEFSLTAIVANVLILEFVPIMMFFGFLLAILGNIFSLLGQVFAPFLIVVLGYMQVVIHVFSVIRLPVGGAPNWIVVAFYYAILCIIAFTRPRTTKPCSVTG